MRFFKCTLTAAFLLILVSSPATAQKNNRAKFSISRETLALYEPGEFKGVKCNTKLTTVTGLGHSSYQSFNYSGDDPNKGYVTEYASDRPDKTDHVWDWLFRQKR